MKWLWFGSGLMTGLMLLSISFASIPTQITDDSKLYEHLSEIRVKKELQVDFDQDLNRLAKLEGRYKENLPALDRRVRGPMKKIEKTRYRHSQRKSSRR